MKNDLNVSTILLVAVVAIGAYLWSSTYVDSYRAQRELEKIYEAKLQVIEAKYDSIEAALKKSEHKYDSAAKVVASLKSNLTAIRKDRDEIIKNYRNLSASDAYDAFIEYLDKRPN